MIGRLRRKPKAKTEAQPPVEAKSAPAKSAAAKPARPGFFDTFRSGWDMPSLKMAGSKAVASGAAARSADPTGRPQRKTVKTLDGVPAQPVTRPELAKQRDRLAREFAELQWDLGGIAYEMASRDHFRMDVLTKQAARLQEVDSQLGQVERVLRLEQEGAAGTCDNCGSLQARGAVFCWKCGKQLKQEAAATKTNEAKTAETKAAQPATPQKTGDAAAAAKPEKS
jgi:hypothetical protein